MQSSAKYLIHATVRTNGVVERSDVVGAIFGQTEGLLGDHLDLRDLQEASKVGRIDVNIESEGGRSIGSVTIASGLDKVETAVLAAALETMDRVGPCHADCVVTEIEDAREAKRRTVVERATELLDELEETTVTSEQIIEEVRQNARVDEITEYEGYPAGPHVTSSDAIILVEGRADVRQLLMYGIKNAVAVEGTDVPTEIAELTVERTATAFLDGDRGGDLILRELQQVGQVEYAAFAPTDQSVEDLDRGTILSALRRKVPIDQVPGGESPREVFRPTTVTESPQDESTSESQSDSEAETPVADGDATLAEEPQRDPEPSTGSDGGRVVETPPADPERDVAEGQSAVSAAEAQSSPENSAVPSAAETVEDGSSETVPSEDTQTESVSKTEDTPEPDTAETEQNTSQKQKSADSKQAGSTEPRTLPGHVEAVITQSKGTARFLDETFSAMADVESDAAFETLIEGEQTPTAIVVDGALTQKLLDGAAQCGVGQIVATEMGEFVKRPTDVRIRTASEIET